MDSVMQSIVSKALETQIRLDVAVCDFDARITIDNSVFANAIWHREPWADQEKGSLRKEERTRKMPAKSVAERVMY